jgi:hypothetical protein
MTERLAFGQLGLAELRNVAISSAFRKPLRDVGDKRDKRWQPQIIQPKTGEGDVLK